MISLIPMAGRGHRFVEEGYQVPKPFIPILEKPMFAAALESFPKARKTFFVCLQEHASNPVFRESIQSVCGDASVLVVDAVTQGQACTCLLAEPHLPLDESLLISSIDYQIVFDQKAFALLAEDPSVDVLIFTFQLRFMTYSKPEQYAYCLADESGRVLKVVEKQLISHTPELDPAVVGTFYYRRASDFIGASKKMIEAGKRVNNEYYVGTSINELIAEGKNVRVFPVDKFICFGTPLDVRLFEAWAGFFSHEPSHPFQKYKGD